MAALTANEKRTSVRGLGEIALRVWPQKDICAEWLAQDCRSQPGPSLGTSP